MLSSFNQPRKLNASTIATISVCKVQILEQLSGNPEGSAAQLCGCCGLNVNFSIPPSLVNVYLRCSMAHVVKNVSSFTQGMQCGQVLIAPKNFN